MENNETRQIHNGFLTLARGECANWFDDGEYCPRCEKYEKRTCRLKLNEPCDYFGLCLALTIDPDNRNYDGGKMVAAYEKHFFGTTTINEEPEIRKCECGAILRPKKQYCQKCAKEKRKENNRNWIKERRKAVNHVDM
jgi:hypothetical protein